MVVWRRLAIVLVCAAVAVGACVAPAAAESRLDARLLSAKRVFEELTRLPDSEIPQKLIQDARCIAVIPGVIKVALVGGGRFGRGVASCKDEGKRWSAPIFETLYGGSLGAQIGVSSTDVVLFFLTEKGARLLLQSRFTFGGDAGVAAGPLGRTAQAGTDLKLEAEVYSYARSKGLFVGVSLQGARLATDDESTTEFYGEYNTPEDILFHHAQRELPHSARQLLSALP